MMLEVDPSKRVSSEELLKCSFLNSTLTEEE
jgi:hypothetical protein